MVNSGVEGRLYQQNQQSPGDSCKTPSLNSNHIALLPLPSRSNRVDRQPQFVNRRSNSGQIVLT
jgi:hypothetical protein